MGASCSVTIADLYMHIHFESKLQLHHWKIFFFFYYRFIDDNLQTIINNFSKLASLPFTGTTPNKSINFLDFNLTIINGAFVSSSYRKPTSQSIYLHYNSHNPWFQRKNVFSNQIYKILTFCSNPIHAMRTVFCQVISRL